MHGEGARIPGRKVCTRDLWMDALLGCPGILPGGLGAGLSHSVTARGQVGAAAEEKNVSTQSQDPNKNAKVKVEST